MKKRKHKKIKIDPIFPLHADLDDLRKRICKLTETAHPFVVQAVAVLLERDNITRQVMDCYRHMLKELEAENVSKD